MAFLQRVARRVRLQGKLWIIRAVALFKRFQPEQVLVIFSDPRGGSTWVSEVVNQVPRSFVYWEPLSPRYNEDLIRHNFHWRQHIPEQANWPGANEVFDRILRVEVLNEWTLSRVGVLQFFRAQQPIVKFCRGNDLVPWFVKNYPTRRKPLVLIRHPMAVVSSQLKHGAWDGEFKGFNFPKDRYTKEKYREHRPFLLSLDTQEEALVATWCLTNKHLLVESAHWLTVFYEDLIREPDTIMAGVFSSWEIPLPGTLAEALRMPSRTSRDFVENDTAEQLSKWQEYFSEDQLARMQAVLDYFAITTYDAGSIYPKSVTALLRDRRAAGG